MRSYSKFSGLFIESLKHCRFRNGELVKRSSTQFNERLHFSNIWLFLVFFIKWFEAWKDLDYWKSVLKTISSVKPFSKLFSFSAFWNNFSWINISSVSKVNIPAYYKLHILIAMHEVSKASFMNLRDDFITKTYLQCAMLSVLKLLFTFT